MAALGDYDQALSQAQSGVHSGAPHFFGGLKD